MISQVEAISFVFLNLFLFSHAYIIGVLAPHVPPVESSEWRFFHPRDVECVHSQHLAKTHGQKPNQTKSNQNEKSTRMINQKCIKSRKGRYSNVVSMLQSSKYSCADARCTNFLLRLHFARHPITHDTTSPNSESIPTSFNTDTRKIISTHGT